MEYRCYIGYWEDRLTLSPHPDDEHLFKELGPLAVVVIDRTILISPDPKGRKGYECARDRNAGIGMAYRWDLGDHPWARFMRQEVTIEMSDDGSMTWDVLADHHLSWPKLQRHGTFDAVAVAQRELYMRGRSALEQAGEDGLKRVLRNVPDKIRRLLAGGTWSYTIQLIREGEELPCT